MPKEITMDEKKRIEEIKSGLKKSVYDEAARIKIEHADDSESTERLSNILEGYVEKIDTIDANNLEELEEELRILKQANIEVGTVEERDMLVKQYNDYIHNDLERTIAETAEYTSTLNNYTDDLNDILIRPMDDEKDELSTFAAGNDNIPNVTPNTDELFEIEATTELGILDDLVELESDTLDLSASTKINEPITEFDLEPTEQKRASVPKRGKEGVAKSKSDKPVESKKVTKSKKQKEKNDDFKAEKKLAAFDYVLIVILIVIVVVLIGLVARINGVF